MKDNDGADYLQVCHYWQSSLNCVNLLFISHYAIFDIPSFKNLLLISILGLSRLVV